MLCLKKCPRWALLPPPRLCKSRVLLNVTTGTQGVWWELHPSHIPSQGTMLLLHYKLPSETNGERSRNLQIKSLVLSQLSYDLI